MPDEALPFLVHAFGGWAAGHHAVALCDELRRFGYSERVQGPDEDVVDVTCRACRATMLGEALANDAISKAALGH